jgi:hypothetical protein
MMTLREPEGKKRSGCFSLMTGCLALCSFPADTRCFAETVIPHNMVVVAVAVAVAVVEEVEDVQKDQDRQVCLLLHWWREAGLLTLDLKG